MGTAERWLAVRDKSFEQICEVLQARNIVQFANLREYYADNASTRVGGPFEQMRFELQSPNTGTRVYGFQSSKGWYILELGRNNVLSVDDGEQISLKLSESAEVINSFVEEHVMYSEAIAYRDGQTIWEIKHDSEKGRKHLDTKGNLPECFYRIRDKELAKSSSSLPDPPKNVASGRTLAPLGKKYKEEPKMFNVPVGVSYDITGYSYARGLDDSLVIHGMDL